MRFDPPTSVNKLLNKFGWIWSSHLGPEEEIVKWKKQTDRGFCPYQGQGRFRISGKGVYMFKRVGVHFAEFVSIFINSLCCCLIWIFKNGGQGVGSGETPLDLPLKEPW